MTLRRKTLSRENIERLFSALADKYKRLGGSEPIELLLVGGAAILTRFRYRAMTLDVDAIFPKNALFLRATKELGEEENLPTGWINDEFMATSSYSEMIREKVTLYKSFEEGLLKIYRLPDAYLIAMKMRANRPTGGDLDDVVHMVAEIKHGGTEITYLQIEQAHVDLYGVGLETCSPLFVSELKTVLAMSQAEVDELYYPPRF